MTPEWANTLSALESQVRSQRRQLRWLKLALVVLPLLGLVGGAAYQNPNLTANTVTAQRFVVKAENGKTRAVIEATATETSFRMFFEDETLASTIRLNQNRNKQEVVSMYHYFPSGRPSFGFVTTPEGISSFALRRPDGKLLIALNGEVAGTQPSVVIGEGQQQVRLTSDK